MESVQNDTAGKSFYQNAAVQGIVWFIIVFIVSYLLVNPSIPSSLVIAGISAIFYTVLIHFWNPF